MKSFGYACTVLLLLAGCSQPGANAGPEPVGSGAVSGVSSTAPVGDIVELVSGVGIGPVRIGMTRKEVEALASRGLTIKAGALGSDLDAGPFAGNAGYRIQMGSHDEHQDVVYAPLPPSSTLEVVCSYVGDMAKPKVSMEDQRKACDRVLSSLSIKP